MKKFPRFKPFLSLKDDLLMLLRLFYQSLSPGKNSHAAVRLEAYFKKPVSLHSSFRIGLYKCLKSLNLSAQDEVLIGTINIPDAVNALLILNLKPVFVDLSLDSHCLDLSDLALKITSRTRVIVLTYLSGLSVNSAAIAQLKELCKSHRIILIEDISQAYGMRIDGALCGTLGDFGVGSFCVGKTLSSTFGGIVVANEQRQKQLARIESPQYKNIFALRFLYLYKHSYFLFINICTSKYIFSHLVHPVLLILSKKLQAQKKSRPIVLNFLEKFDIFNDEYLDSARTGFPTNFFFSLGAWQENMITLGLDKLDNNNLQRQKLAAILIKNLGLVAKASLPGSLFHTTETIYYHFPIYCKGHKEEIIRYLLKKGIDTAGYGLNLCHRETIFSSYFLDCPSADVIKNDCLFLPLHEDYTEEDMLYIAKTINVFYDATF